MNKKTAVVIGATGMIGNLVTEELLEDQDFRKVRVLTRRSTEMKHPKLEEVIVDFNSYYDYEQKFGSGDVVFCCVGTTQKKVEGNQEAYKKVDYNIPVEGAEIALKNGFSGFFLVSSVGADENASNFYLQLKGKTENAIRKLPFNKVAFFRPSILLGKRNEPRSGEQIAKALMRIFSKLLFAGYRKYRAIDAVDVAKAMVLASKNADTGVHIFEYDQMMDILK